MKNGDISNQSGYCIAFRCEDFVVRLKDNSLIDKVLNVFNKYQRADINLQVLRTMEHIYKNTEYTVTLIVENKTYKDLGFKELIDNLPFNDIILVDKPSQISQRLITGEISLYIDDDLERLSLINSPYAIPFKDLNKFLSHIKVKR